MLKNKYAIWYDSIINRARGRILTTYTERHHVVPKSLGGTNAADNLVKLTAREHYICHKLLIRMTEGAERQKMLWAMHMMLHNARANVHDRYKPSARQYDLFRQEFAASLKKPRQITPEHRAAIVAANRARKGGTWSEETRAKTMATRAKLPNPMLGKKHSEESKRKMSENRKTSR